MLLYVEDVSAQSNNKQLPRYSTCLGSYFLLFEIKSGYIGRNNLKNRREREERVRKSQREEV
ncbi:MAG: hypothetical protein WBF90_14270 [Rivularia sp. (in: cyanobacteria)]